MLGYVNSVVTMLNLQPIEKTKSQESAFYN